MDHDGDGGTTTPTQCAEPSATGGVCDEASDCDSTAFASTCDSDSVCRRNDGQECSANADCTNACINHDADATTPNQCAAPSATGGVCDEASDCDSTTFASTCDSDSLCRRNDGQECSTNADCSNACINHDADTTTPNQCAEPSTTIDLTYDDHFHSKASLGPIDIHCEDFLNDGFDNDADGVTDGCLLADTLNVGQIGLGGQGSVLFYISNSSNCTPAPGNVACSTCALVLEKDSTRQNIGIGFKQGTNEQGYFSLLGSTATPTVIPQVDEACIAPGTVPLTVLFDAPETAGAFTSTIVIESNDPDRPLIELVVTAEAVNAPIAIANIREADPNNLSAPYTNADTIAPLDRVYLDGRAKGNDSSTHHPQDPGDTSLIALYDWTVVEYPQSTNLSDFDVMRNGLGLFSMLVPASGTYVIRLSVATSQGQQSLVADESTVVFTAIAQHGLHIQLAWDKRSDQDLHLVHVLEDGRVCNEPYDVFYNNKRPVWNNTFFEGTGPNPVLDRDEHNGVSPEAINIDAPDPGVYRVYVHYFGNRGAAGQSLTENVLKIYINGIQGAQYKRSLDDTGAVWAVADIIWFLDGTASIVPYPSDAAGETGAIEYMQNCSPPNGWVFP
jgi:hypothetical protein